MFSECIHMIGKAKKRKNFFPGMWNLTIGYYSDWNRNNLVVSLVANLIVNLVVNLRMNWKNRQKVATLLVGLQNRFRRNIVFHGSFDGWYTGTPSFC